ncbi:winged helix DNA-binding domain-containing protein [Streptomyces decoyicus]|uniref:winged helix DNA-binding domain-containing protein n=1 Tax=Streptomyces decoyicus TaxID=249567 RepID=UPI002E369DC8|nr:winged helix DNA-binding domain-containing protein [Streptomyces decoyicus]
MATRMPASSRPHNGEDGTPVLSTRALNRALLARQLLLRRHQLGVLDAVSRLIGLQAQAPNPPYIGLWTRLDGFAIGDLAGALEDRSLTRIAVMRSTVHLVTAQDCRTLRPLTQPALDRDLWVGSGSGKAVDGVVDPAELAAAARAALAEAPLTTAELGEALQQRWPEVAARHLAYAARTLLPLVQVPPRGIWGVGGRTRYATAESWLGEPLTDGLSLQEVVLRYLAAYGPATVKDVQLWSGLTRLRPVLDGLRDRLRTFRDGAGHELFDVPGAPLPDPDLPAPVRFLPEFDNILLSHADRGRIITDEDRRRIFTRNGIVRATFLVDGFVRGMWAIDRDRDGAVLRVEPFAPLGAPDRAALSEEGARLLAFAAADARAHDIRFAPPGG